MTQDVRLRREAERDIEEAARWYEHQRSVLGQQFLDEVSRVLAKVAEQPSLYPALYRNTRRP